MPLWQEILLAVAIVAGSATLGAKLTRDTPKGKYASVVIALLGLVAAIVLEIVVGAPSWLVISLASIAAVISLGSGGEDVPEGWTWIGYIVVAPGALAALVLAGALAWFVLGKVVQSESLQSGFGLLKETPNISEEEYREVGSAQLDTRTEVEDRFGEGEKSLRGRDPRCRYFWKDELFSTEAYEICFDDAGQFDGKEEIDTEAYP